MKYAIYTFLQILCCVTFTAIDSIAQPSEATAYCAKSKINFFSKVASRPTVLDEREDKYDVKHIQITLDANHQNTAIKGHVTTSAQTVVGYFDEYVFELFQGYTIDSVKLNNTTPLSVISTGALRVASIPNPLAMGTYFSVTVYYHGQVNGGGSFWSGGIRNESDNMGKSYTYTLSEPYGASDWLPIKQSLKDKIDSCDVWITVDSNLKVGSNGLLQEVTPVGSNKNTYKWKHRYPIDYYLISIAISDYAEYSYKMYLPLVNDSMLFQNYVPNDNNYITQNKPKIDSTVLMIQYFSNIFGIYPFWKEKYGHCITPLGGGMEHQTMTTQGNFNGSLTAHELGHQWFGDHVTCGTWADIWLNESFATYLDYLYQYNLVSPTQGNFTMGQMHDYAMSQAGGSVYCTDTTSIGRIFDARLSYQKGAAVIHTLRSIVNNDPLFFNMLKQYQSNFSHSTATTEHFKQFAEVVLNRNLDNYFDQWIYGEGYPTIGLRWNQIGNQVVIKTSQTTSASVPFFNIPLEVQLRANGADTTVRFEFNTNDEAYFFTWNPTINQITIDPNNWIINRNGDVRKDLSLNINGTEDSNLLLIYPNPAANNYWQIDGTPAQSQFILYDAAGRKVMNLSNGASNYIRINNQQLATGSYVLKILNSKNEVLKTEKLLK